MNRRRTLYMLAALGVMALMVAFGLTATRAATPVQQDKPAGYTHSDTVALSNATLSDRSGSDRPKVPLVWANKAAQPVPTDRHAAATTASYLYTLGGEY
jgi:hypothetical protein